MSNRIPKEVDIVVAGGGAAGIVVASRLAKADPTLLILILEHGPDVRENPQVVNPALFITNLLPGSKTATFYTAEPSEHLNGRRAIVAAGGCPGGGGSINFLAYVRPQEIDFDDWEVEGWSGKEMIPFFKKFENFQDPDPEIDPSIHGYGGELSVSQGSNVQEGPQQDFFKACETLGIGRVADIADFKTSNGVGKWHQFVDKNDGIRQNTPHGFLYPILDANNTGLQVATEVKVGRILFEEDTNRANGVEYFTERSSKPQVVYARKQVILTAVFNAGFLSNPADVEQMLYGYKLQRDIARRLSHYRGPLETSHPKFPPGSKASYDYVDGLSAEKGSPVPIEYTPEDDDAIRDYIRQSVETTWHSMSTCAMKKRELGGVVDERLNVYGVERLKVADLSICPQNVAANTYSTALAIGEKAATLVAEDLGITL
ncbi:glucose-methanol-choline oxidoreductase [Talaromyces pinophilus]|uniref:Glucose-methanol-choline oxidoreductase n=1 Tax=Talaromyces pinophilus TaxID=128442 RepID=A0A6V8H6S7_TALPI|nr:glucose-methanol-choline oxidoreductase [Talaromyces pinophilus]